MDKQLAHFIGIIESGGLAAAADRLHVGQPALTASLKKLEERYGAQLVSRHNRGVRPTKSGELVYDHALLMQRLESGIQNKVRQAEGFENTPLNKSVYISNCYSSPLTTEFYYDYVLLKCLTETLNFFHNEDEVLCRLLVKKIHKLEQCF